VENEKHIPACAARRKLSSSSFGDSGDHNAVCAPSLCNAPPTATLNTHFNQKSFVKFNLLELASKGTHAKRKKAQKSVLITFSLFSLSEAKDVAQLNFFAMLVANRRLFLSEERSCLKYAQFFISARMCFLQPLGDELLSTCVRNVPTRYDFIPNKTELRSVKTLLRQHLFKNVIATLGISQML
jgi:hypothetical protein